jgi:type IV secretory pathway TrbD component
VKQVVVIALVLVIFLGLMGLRVWFLLRHRVPGKGDPELVQRWARHLYRGGDGD